MINISSGPVVARRADWASSSPWFFHSNLRPRWSTSRRLPSCSFLAIICEPSLLLRALLHSSSSLSSAPRRTSMPRKEPGGRRWARLCPRNCGIFRYGWYGTSLRPWWWTPWSLRLFWLLDLGSGSGIWVLGICFQTPPCFYRQFLERCI